MSQDLESGSGRGPLRHGPHAEEVLENETGFDQSDGKEGGRARGGVGRRSGCKAGGTGGKRERDPALAPKSSI